MTRVKLILFSICAPVVFIFLSFNLLNAGIGPYIEIVCGILWTTEYTVTNVSQSAGTTNHTFYDEMGFPNGTTDIPLPPQGSASVTVANYVPAGYEGYVAISADIPVSATVDVGPGAWLRANFDADPTNGSAPLTVNFTNTSTGNDMSLWSFGDGVTSTVESPTYTYTIPGTYTVDLTVSQTGCLETIPQFNPTASAVIYVESGNSQLYLPVVLGE